MAKIQMTFMLVVEDDDYTFWDLVGGLEDFYFKFASPEEAAAWVKKRLGDDGPGGLIDPARVEREVREALEKIEQQTAQATNVANGDSGGTGQKARSAPARQKGGRRKQSQ